MAEDWRTGDVCWFCDKRHPGAALGVCSEWTEFRHKVDVAYQKYVLKGRSAKRGGDGRVGLKRWIGRRRIDRVLATA